MSEFSFSNSSKTNKILPSSFLLSLHLFNMFFFIFLSPYILSLLCSFSPLFFTTLFLLALFPPTNPDQGGDDDSPSSDSKLGFLPSVVEYLVRKLSSKNDENDEEVGWCEDFQAYLDVFRAPIFKVLEGNFSESWFSGEEGRESKAHVGPIENKPKSNFDQNPFGKDDDNGVKVEAAGLIAGENKFCEKKCNEVLEENFSESGHSGNDDGRESSRNHVGPQEKEPSFSFDENPFEKDKGKLESARPIAEENKFFESDCSGEEEGSRSHVDLIEDPTVNLDEETAGEDDDVDKVGKNTKLDDMFCQKRDKEVKPLDTDSNKAAEESKEEKMTLMRRSGSKVMCNDTANSEEEEEEEYFGFGTPERYWEYNRRRSYGGSMRKEKEWRRTLAFKLYEERKNNVDDNGSGSSSSNSEAMDLLWETYEDREHDKVKEKSSKSTEDNDDCEDEEDEEEEEEKEKGMESKYCCLQALKFSAGKVNLGMRKPSLVKISKALKSIGFLQHVRSKNGRKKIH